jgi:hypothetical protein
VRVCRSSSFATFPFRVTVCPSTSTWMFPGLLNEVERSMTARTSGGPPRGPRGLDISSKAQQRRIVAQLERFQLQAPIGVAARRAGRSELPNSPVVEHWMRPKTIPRVMTNGWPRAE